MSEAEKIGMIIFAGVVVALGLSGWAAAAKLTPKWLRRFMFPQQSAPPRQPDFGF